MTVASMEIASIDPPKPKATKAKARETKPKAPEENPWTKRPLYVPEYAREALEHLCKVDPALTPLVAKYPYAIYSDHDTNYFR